MTETDAVLVAVAVAAVLPWWLSATFDVIAHVAEYRRFRRSHPLITRSAAWKSSAR